MMIIFWLAIAQGWLGAMDTFVYHEFILRLPNTPSAQREQLLHGLRDLLYAVLYLQLGLANVFGGCAALILMLLGAEIVITLADFLQEDATRRLPRGERVMHTLIAILYGAFLAYYLPVLWTNSGAATSVEFATHNLTPLFCLMSVGAAGMAWRDVGAYLRLRQV